MEVGGESFPFTALPATETEVKALEQRLGEVDLLINGDFTPDAMAELPSYGIVHLATHAAFVTGSPDDSFILFGDRSTVNLRAISSDWDLSNAELVVLSACETAVGSTELGTGIEILGLGYQIEQAGAQATLASLWKVSDGGTQTLMSAFYTALANGHGKAEALQRAQQALITSNQTVLEGDRGAAIDIVDARTGEPLAQSPGLAHPYYWAPFILIGNGL